MAKVELIPAVGSPDGCSALGLSDSAGLSRVTEAGITRKFRRSPVQPPSAAGASLTHVVHSQPGLRSVVRRLRPGRLLAPASRRRFALHDGWTTWISPRGAAARRARALPTLRPPPPGAIRGGPPPRPEPRA